MKQLQHYVTLYAKSLKFVWTAAPLLTLVMVVMIPIQALLPSLTLLITNQMINQLSAGQTALIGLLVIWGILFLLNNVASPLNTFIQGQLTDQLTYALNEKIMKKSEELQTIDWYEQSDFHNKVELLSSEASWRPVNLLVFGTSLISNVILVLSMIGLLMTYHWLIAVAILVALIPQSIIAYKVQQQAFETLVSNSEDSRKLTYYANTLLTADAIKEVRLYRLYDYFKKKYYDTFTAIKQGVQKNRQKQFLTSAFFLVITGIISVVSFFYLVQRIQSGQLEVGAILVFASSIVYMIQGITRLVEDSSLLYDTLLYMENLDEFLAIQDTVTFGTQEFAGEFKTIEFSNVDFAYVGQEHPALKNISLTIHQGEKIAIVGENGAGKSTLVKVLLELYPVTSGTITIDGVPIQQFSPESYRAQFSSVFQDFAKFDLTVRENVQLSDLTVESEARVKDSLLKAGLEEDELGSLDQMLGKKFGQGHELSGGQWQKLALARAFYADKPLLILDEPTAAIDAKTENFIYNKFLELATNKTVLFITHRLATVKKADRVLVLKDGQIIGFDTHEQLIQKNLYYQELYNLQASMYQED